MSVCPQTACQDNLHERKRKAGASPWVINTENLFYTSHFKSRQIFCNDLVSSEQHKRKRYFRKINKQLNPLNEVCFKIMSTKIEDKFNYLTHWTGREYYFEIVFLTLITYLKYYQIVKIANCTFNNSLVSTLRFIPFVLPNDFSVLLTFQ